MNEINGESIIRSFDFIYIYCNNFITKPAQKITYATTDILLTVIMTITVLKFVTDCTAELLCHNLLIMLQDFLIAQQQT
jgi:hypothetical protein